MILALLQGLPQSPQFAQAKLSTDPDAADVACQAKARLRTTAGRLRFL